MNEKNHDEIPGEKGSEPGEKVPSTPGKPRISFGDCFGIAFFGWGLINILLVLWGITRGGPSLKINGQVFALSEIQFVLLALGFILVGTLVVSITIFIGQAIYRFLLD